MNPRIIAFYLPQYHPTSNNDKWWGKGFTEWTNVGKAKPLFKGHEQPKVPADLGYYDLRLPEVRLAQAKMAKEAGIEGFCYYHYWFKKGHEELDFPFKEVLRINEPDFPFCLCWANESWNKKFWNVDGTFEKEVLAEQFYETASDHEIHFYSLLSAFKDKRYIKVNGKLLFMIYKPLDFVGIQDFMQLWNKLAYENGLNGFHFVAQTTNPSDIDKILNLGFSGVNIVRLLQAFNKYYGRHNLKVGLNSLIRRILNRPYLLNYKKAIEIFSNNHDSDEAIYPTLIPNWDHTPRSGRGGLVLTNSTPELFKVHVLKVLDIVNKKDEEKNLVFLKSWNEWGEGNYVEPDLRYGKGFLNVLQQVLHNKK